MQEKLRYACIGAGGIARKKHMNGYSRLPQIELAAVCDTNRGAAEKLASEFGVKKVYTDHREMLEKEHLDIVSICTPNHTHRSIAAEALQYCNVHVEKPMALNSSEAKEIVMAGKRSGKKVQVGLNKRFLSSTILLKRMMKEDFFGNIYRVRCGWERNSGIPGTGRWFTDSSLSGGGALIDLGVHYLDLAMYFMGWPKAEKIAGSVSSNFLKEGTRIRRGYSNADGLVDVEDSANGTVLMKEGQTLEYCFSWASNIEKEVRYLELYGTKAGVRMVNDELQIFTQAAGTMFTLTPDPATMPLDENEFINFVDSIQNNSIPEATAEQALKVMELIDRIYACSIRFGENKYDHFAEQNCLNHGVSYRNPLPKVYYMHKEGDFYAKRE